MTTQAKSNPIKKIIVSIIVIALLVLGYAFLPGNKEKKVRSPKPANAVSFVTAKTQDVPIEARALGTVTAANTAIVVAKVDGEVQKILFTEGQIVEENQPLVTLDSRSLQADLQQAKGTLQSNKALLSNAKEDLVRYQQLEKQKSITQQKLDAQQALVNQLAGTVESNQASVTTAELQLSYATITAPISGRIGLRKVDVGNQLKAAANTEITTITQTEPMFILFSLPDRYLDSVLLARKNQQILTVEAWGKYNKIKLATGQLTAFDNQIDSDSSTFQLKATFKDVSDKLFPNQFVNVRIRLSVLPNVLTIPQAAIQVGSDSQFVWRINSENKVENVPITTGQQQDDYVVINKGLNAGDKIVIDGVDRLQKGMTVNPIAKTNKDGDKSNSADATNADKNTDKTDVKPDVKTDETNKATDKTERKKHKKNQT